MFSEAMNHAPSPPAIEQPLLTSKAKSIMQYIMMGAFKLLSELAVLFSLILATAAEGVEQCQQLVTQSTVVDALQLYCSGDNSVYLSWMLPVDNLITFEKLIIGYICYTDSQDIDDLNLYQTIDTSVYTFFTTTTNATNCIARGCTSQHLSGRQPIIWSNLNNATCYNSKEDYFFPSSDETALETMISPYSTINMIEKLDSSDSSLPVSVPASVKVSDIQTPSTTNLLPTVYELQPQIIIAITLTCSILFFTFIAVVLFISTGYWRKRITLKKSDDNNNFISDSPAMIAYSVPTLSTSPSIMTLYDSPLLTQSDNEQQLSSSVLSQNEHCFSCEKVAVTNDNAEINTLSEHCNTSIIIIEETSMNDDIISDNDSNDIITVVDTSIPLSSSDYIRISETYNNISVL